MLNYTYYIIEMPLPFEPYPYYKNRMLKEGEF